MTKAQQSARDEAIATLRETLKPGTVVYTVLRNVSRSGMSRDIDVYVIENGTPRWLSRLVARAIGFTFNEKRDCLKVGGCGMDMGFHVVSTLSRVLYREGFPCLGENCPSNDHNNAYYHERNGECVVCHKPIGDESHTRVLSPRRGYKVCSETCESGEWIHKSGDYALVHKWM